ncbi:MAG: 50S ribosomal protein L4 [Mycoplasma sp.]|nr:50S ribosomal protein L4 [Mycoplasma sp.]
MPKPLFTKSVNKNDLNLDYKNFNHELITQVIVADRASLRLPTHKVKTRGEVRGGGRKPWRQKGTGNARAGSIRSPIWVGGGVIFGPQTNRNYKVKINKKAKKLAFSQTLANAISLDKIKINDFQEFDKPSTKNFYQILLDNNMTNKKILIVSTNPNVQLSVRNIRNVFFTHQQSLTTEYLLGSDLIIFSDNQWKSLVERIAI